MQQKIKNLSWLWLAAVIIAGDQIAKYLIIQHLPLGSGIRLTSFLNLISAHNSGAAFSFLDTASGWQSWLFGIIAVIVSFVIIRWILQLPKNKKWLAISLTLILSGALGNLLDRILHGFVIDFIDFHLETWHYATFNIADAAITIGSIMLIVSVVRDRNKENTISKQST